MLAHCSWDGCAEVAHYDADAWKCPPTWALLEWIGPEAALHQQAILCPAHYQKLIGDAPLRPSTVQGPSVEEMASQTCRATLRFLPDCECAPCAARRALETAT